MKRDMDLVRAILLAVEEGHGDIDIQDGLPGTEASAQELEYHLNLAQQAGLLDVAGVTLGGGYHIQGLTWEGHDFLDTIRDPEVWKRTKEGATKVGGWSFGLLKDLATAYIKSEAKGRLGFDL